MDPAFSEVRDHRIRREMERLRAADFGGHNDEQVRKRLAWWEGTGRHLRLEGALPHQAYTLFLIHYLGLDPVDVPVVYEDEHRIAWRARNFCPTLEACLRLGLDTRTVCRSATEASVQTLIACLDPRLRFSRDYQSGIRPYAAHCQEQIELLDTA